MNSLPNDKIRRLKNAACAYCGAKFGAGVERTSEHVIGRRFVPKGTLAGQWNLVLACCRPCNEMKAVLEGEISAITLQHDLCGHVPREGLSTAEAARKDSAISTRTGKPVRDSKEDLKIECELMPGVKMTFNMTAGPQLAEDKVYKLAGFHVGGFFYMITYDSETRLGSGVPGCFAPIAVVPRSDWGNAQIMGFQELIADWPWRLNGIGASTFFGVMIRRNPCLDPPLWAWALEWNKSHRVFGFMGDEAAIRSAYSSLPALEEQIVERGKRVGDGPEATWARPEVSLEEDRDRLFVWTSDEGSAASS